MGHGALILCASPRSGTTLLCDLLTATGVAGRPASYYRAEDIAYWAERMGVAFGEGPAFERAYLNSVVQRGTGGTGTFALRLMWPSLAELMARRELVFPGLADDSARLEAAFGAPLYVHLSRRDKVAQAVSRLKAHQTGLWHMGADGTERERTAPHQAPGYDHERLAGFVAEAETADAEWNRWFAQHGITPVRVSYEDVAADPRAALARVLVALGRDPALAQSAEIRTAKMADAESRAWVERFERERARGRP